MTDQTSDRAEAARARLWERALEVADAIARGERVIPELPSAADANRSPAEIARMVAVCSNVHAQIAQYAGACVAEYRRAKMAYDRAVRVHATGSNEHERRRNAVEATTEEAEWLSHAESMMRLFVGLEDGARVASESARRMLDNASKGEQSYDRADAVRDLRDDDEDDKLDRYPFDDEPKDW